jgi:hypothetical protein
MVVWFVIATPDEVVSRRLRLDLGGHVEPRLLDPFRHCLATGKESETNDKIEEAKFHGRRLQPSFIAASARLQLRPRSHPLLASLDRDDAGWSFTPISLLHRAGMLVKLSAMIELEVYAAGVRDLNKILELDHQLEAVPALRYKVDSNHDIVYLELDEATITLREIRSIFLKLGLEPRFVGEIPPELRPRSKTQLLSA